MENKSDGGIVLSVNIDSSEISSDMKKVVKEINKQVQAEAKNIKAVESINQAKEKTAQLQQKTEKAVYNSLEAENKALTAENNLKIAKEKSTEAEAKKETAIWNSLKAEQSAVREEQKLQTDKALSEQRIANLKESNEQKITNSQQLNAQLVENAKLRGEQSLENSRASAEQRLNAQELKNEENLATLKAKNLDDIDTKRKANEEKKKREEEKTASQQLKNQEKLNQEKEKTAILEEKHKREILKTEKAQNSLYNATSKTALALKKMASVLGIAFSIREILTFSNEASELASQTEASVKRLGTLYGEYAQGVYDWTNKNASALGMSKTAAYQAAAAYGNIFSTFASAEESADLTKDVLQATAVIASQTGRTYEETFEKIRSGLYGNTRAIDDLGISVRQSSLMQTEAYKQVSQNGTKAWNDLTDAELQQVRALAIVEQSTLKYGNNVLQSTALVRSQLSSAWEDFKSTWGQVVNTILVPIMQSLTQILNIVNTLMTSVLGMFGITLEVKNAQSGIVSQQAQQIDNQKDLNKELEKTKKKMSDQLQSFDKINKLSEDTSNASNSTSNVGATGGTVIPEVVKTEADFSEIEGLSINLEKIKGILEAITVLIATIGGSLLAWKIADTVIKNSTALLSAFKLISGVALLIAGSVLLIKGYCEGWAEGIDWKNFSLVMTGLFGVISGIAFVLSPMAAAWVSVGGGIALVVLGIKDIISNGASLQNILTVVAGVATSIIGVLGAMGKINVISTLIPLLASLAGIVIALRVYFDSLINGLDWGNFATILGGLAVAVVGVNIAIGGLATNIALGLAGVLALIAGMNDFVKNGPTIQNIILIIGGAIATSVALATGGVSVLTSAIVGVVAAVGAFVVALATEKSVILSVEEAQENLTSAKEKARNAEETYINSVDNAEKSLKTLQKAEKKAGTTGKSLYKQVKSGKLEYSKMTDTQKELYKAYLNNEEQQSNLEESTKKLEEAKKAETLASFENQLSLAKENGSYEEYKKAVISAYNEGALSADEARDLIGKSMSEMSDSSQQTFMQDIPNDIKDGLDPTQYETSRKQLSDFASSTFETISTALSNVWTSIGDFYNKNIAPWFTKDKWTGLISQISSSFSSSTFYTKISGIWSSVTTYWDENIAPWFTKDKWETLIGNILSKFSPTTFKDKIKSVRTKVKDYWNDKIKPWFTKDKWTTLVGNILSRFSPKSFKNKLKDVWTKVKEYWNDKIKPWFTKDKWKTLAGNIVSGLKEKFKSGINSIIGFFESMINSVIDMFNKISFTVPDWVPELGGKKYGIDIAHVSIPRLAKGAVIPANREFLAVLGDQKQGTNIEAPAKLIKQMAMEAIMETGGTGGKETIEIPIYLDSDVLYRAIVDRNQKYKKAMGVSPLGI